MNRQKFDRIISYLAEQIKNTELENKVFAVGGCVRDLLMDNDIHDIDIAVNVPSGGEMLGSFLNARNLLVHDCVTFPAYSVCKFVLKEFPDVEIEAVQTRKETYDNPNSRNPETAFGSIEEDCLRRDLTINSLYMNVSTGEILDITGFGKEDIKNKIIRTPLDPDETFSDDPLRMLRVLRFAARFRFGFKDDSLFESIRKNSHRLSIISRERIHDEFIKMIQNEYAPQALWLLTLTELLDKEFHIKTYPVWGTGYTDFLYMLDKCDWRLKIVGAFFGIEYDKDCECYRGLNEVEKFRVLLKSLKFSNSDIKYMTSVMKYIYRMGDIIHEGFTWETRRKLMNKMFYEMHSYELFRDCELLYRAMICPEGAYKLHEILQNAIKSHIGVQDFFTFELPLSGDEIMEITHCQQGPKVAEYMNMLIDYACQKRVMGKEGLIEYLKDNIENEKQLFLAFS